MTPAELKLISRASAVLLPQGCSAALHAACVAEGPALFPEYGPRFAFPGKVGQSLLFARLGLPRPRTFRWRSPKEFICARSGGKQGCHSLPVIVKTDSDHEGHGVFFAPDDPALHRALDAVAAGGGGGFITQDFVAPGGAVLRVVVVGGRALSYWKRSTVEGDVIVTIARNAVVDHMWKPELQAEGVELCRRLTSATGINLAAVDVIFHLDAPAPAPLLLEINYFFGRRGLGGSKNYYRLLLEAARDWTAKLGLDPRRVRPV